MNTFTWDDVEERWIDRDGRAVAAPSRMVYAPPRLSPWAQFARAVERGAELSEALHEVERSRGRTGAAQVTDRLRSLVLAVGEQEVVG